MVMVCVVERMLPLTVRLVRDRDCRKEALKQAARAHDAASLLRRERAM